MNETGGYPLDFIGFFCETVRHHAGRWWSGARWYHLDFIGFSMRAGGGLAPCGQVVVWRHAGRWAGGGLAPDGITLILLAFFVRQ